jgi:hypothetical protein
MPIHYRYDDTAHRVLTRCEGQLTLQEVISHFRELSRSTRLHPGSDVLVDVTFQTNVPQPENLASAASVLEEVTELIPFGRCAIVAPNDIANEIGRRFQAVTWPLFTGIRLFATNADAIAWLDGE